MRGIQNRIRNKQREGDGRNLQERLRSKNSKSRFEAFGELLRRFAEAPSTDAIFAEHYPMFSTFISDSHSGAQDRALDALLILVGKYGAKLDTNFSEMVSAIVEKGYVAAKTTTKSKATDCLMAIAELEGTQTAVYDQLTGYLTSTTAPKIAAAALQALRQLLNAFGEDVFPVARVLPMVGPLAASTHTGLRSEVSAYIREAHRWKATAATAPLQSLRPAQQEELKKHFAEDTIPPKVLRHVKGKKADIASVLMEDIKVNRTEHTAIAPKLPRPKDVPVFSFTKFGESWCSQLLGLKKWSEKRDKLEELAVATTAETLPKDYGTVLLTTLKKLLSDSNIAVVNLAIRIIGQLGKGLRGPIATYAKQVFMPIVQKCRDKKTMVETQKCIANLVLALKADDLAELVKEAIADKSPLVKVCISDLIASAILPNCTALISRGVLAASAQLLIKLTDDANSEVRESILTCLGSAKAALNDSSLNRLMQDLSVQKQEKIAKAAQQYVKNQPHDTPNSDKSRSDPEPRSPSNPALKQKHLRTANQAPTQTLHLDREVSQNIAKEHNAEPPSTLTPAVINRALLQTTETVPQGGTAIVSSTAAERNVKLAVDPAFTSQTVNPAVSRSSYVQAISESNEKFEQQPGSKAYLVTSQLSPLPATNSGNCAPIQSEPMEIAWQEKIPEAVRAKERADNYPDATSKALPKEIPSDQPTTGRIDAHTSMPANSPMVIQSQAKPEVICIRGNNAEHTLTRGAQRREQDIRPTCTSKAETHVDIPIALEQTRHSQHEDNTEANEDKEFPEPNSPTDTTDPTEANRPTGHNEQTKHTEQQVSKDCTEAKGIENTGSEKKERMCDEEEEEEEEEKEGPAHTRTLLPSNESHEDTERDPSAAREQQRKVHTEAIRTTRPVSQEERKQDTKEEQDTASTRTTNKNGCELPQNPPYPSASSNASPDESKITSEKQGHTKETPQCNQKAMSEAAELTNPGQTSPDNEEDLPQERPGCSVPQDVRTLHDTNITYAKSKGVGYVASRVTEERQCANPANIQNKQSPGQEIVVSQSKDIIMGDNNEHVREVPTTQPMEMQDDIVLKKAQGRSSMELSTLDHGIVITEEEDKEGKHKDETVDVSETGDQEPVVGSNSNQHAQRKAKTETAATRQRNAQKLSKAAEHSKLLPALASLKVEDVGPLTTIEEATAAVALTLPAELISKLNETEWKTRLQGLQELHEWLQQWKGEPSWLEALVVWLKSKLKDFKENNPGLLKETFVLVQTLTTNFPISKQVASILVPPFLERLSDPKLMEKGVEVLMGVADSATPTYVARAAVVAGCGTKSVHTVKGTLTLLTRMLEEYGTTLTPLKTTVEFAKHSLSHANPQVRAAATTHILAAYTLVGESLKPFLASDLKDSTYKQLETELAKQPSKGRKEPADPQEVPRRGRLRGETERELESKRLSAETAESMFPRVSIAGQVTSKLLAGLSNASMKHRQEAKDVVEKLLAGANYRILPVGLGPLTNALKTRMNEPGKNLAKGFIALVGQLALALGPHCKQYSKVLLPPLMYNLADKQSAIRAETLLAIDRFAEAGGPEIVLSLVAPVLEKDNPELRTALLNWLLKHPQSLRAIDSTPLLPALVAALQDRSAAVRGLAEAVVSAVLPRVGLPAFATTIQDLKPAVKNSINDLLTRLALPSSPSPSLSGGTVPRPEPSPPEDQATTALQQLHLASAADPDPHLNLHLHLPPYSNPLPADRTTTQVSETVSELRSNPAETQMLVTSKNPSASPNPSTTPNSNPSANANEKAPAAQGQKVKQKATMVISSNLTRKPRTAIARSRMPAAAQPDPLVARQPKTGMTSSWSTAELAEGHKRPVSRLQRVPGHKEVLGTIPMQRRQTSNNLLRQSPSKSHLSSSSTAGTLVVEMVVLNTIGNKARRAEADKKNQWPVHEVRADYVEKLKKALVTVMHPRVYEYMFAKQLKKNVEVIRLLTEAMRAEYSAVVDIIDLLYKWVTMQLIDQSNPVFAKSAIEFIKSSFTELSRHDTPLLDFEAAAILPILCDKLGSLSPTLQDEVRQLIQVACPLCGPPLVANFLVQSLTSKTPKTKQEALRLLTFLVSTYTPKLLPKSDLKKVAKLLASTESGIKTAAADLLVELYKKRGEKLWETLGDLPEKSQQLLDQRLALLDSSNGALNGDPSGDPNGVLNGDPSGDPNYGPNGVLNDDPSGDPNDGSNGNDQDMAHPKQLPSHDKEAEQAQPNNVKIDEKEQTVGLTQKQKPAAHELPSHSPLHTEADYLRPDVTAKRSPNHTQMGEVTVSLSSLQPQSRLPEISPIASGELAGADTSPISAVTNQMQTVGTAFNELKVQQQKSTEMSPTPSAASAQPLHTVEDSLKLLRQGMLANQVDALVSLNEKVTTRLEEFKAEWSNCSDLVFSTFAAVLQTIFNQPITTIPFRFAKYFLGIANKVFATRAVTKDVSEEPLMALLEQLLTAMLLASSSSNKQNADIITINTSLNSTTIKLLESVYPTRMYVALFRLLRKFKDVVSAHDKDVPTQLPRLIAKCILKLNKVLPQLLPNIDPALLLLAMHEYIVEWAPMRSAETLDKDFGRELVKSTLDELVKLKREAIWDAYRSLEQHPKHDRHMKRWIEAILKSLLNNISVTLPTTQPSVQPSVASSPSSLEAIAELKVIFKNLNSSTSFNQAIRSLAKYLERHPGFDLKPFFASCSHAFTDHVLSALEKLQHEDTAGLPSSALLLHSSLCIAFSRCSYVVDISYTVQFYFDKPS